MSSIRFPTEINQVYTYNIDNNTATSSGTCYFEGVTDMDKINKVVLNTTALSNININHVKNILANQTYKTITINLFVIQSGNPTRSLQAFSFNITSITESGNTIELKLSPDPSFYKWKIDTNTANIFFTISEQLPSIPKNLLDMPLVFESSNSPVLSLGKVNLDRDRKILRISNRTADIQQLYKNIDVNAFYTFLIELSTFGLQVQYKRNDIQYTFDVTNIIFDTVESVLSVYYNNEHVGIGKRSPLYTTDKKICVVFGYNNQHNNLYSNSLYSIWSATGYTGAINNFNTTFAHSFTGTSISGHVNYTEISETSGIPLYPISPGATGAIMNIYSRYAPDISDIYFSNTILRQTATGVYGYSTLKEYVDVIYTQENPGKLNIKFSPTTTPTDPKTFDENRTNTILVYDIISAETGILNNVMDERIHFSVSYNSGYNFETSIPATGYCEVFFEPYSDTNNFTTNAVSNRIYNISKMRQFYPNAYTNLSDSHDNIIKGRNNFNSLLGYNMSQTLVSGNINSTISQSNFNMQFRKYGNSI